MSATLLALAAQVGVPLLTQAVSNRLGPANGRLAENVLGAVAQRVGVAPDALEHYASQHPEEVQGAMQRVEDIIPEMIQLQMAEAETREALLLAETRQGGWQAWWRPGWMYLLGVLWIWQVIGLHVLNAMFKIALPPSPWEYLMGLTAVITGLYMGGHTIKDVAKTWKAAR